MASRIGLALVLGITLATIGKSFLTFCSVWIVNRVEEVFWRFGF